MLGLWEFFHVVSEVFWLGSVLWCGRIASVGSLLARLCWSIWRCMHGWDFPGRRNFVSAVGSDSK